MGKVFTTLTVIVSLWFIIGVSAPIYMIVNNVVLEPGLKNTTGLFWAAGMLVGLVTLTAGSKYQTGKG